MEETAKNCFWAMTCTCSCATCKGSNPTHCGNHNSSCHMNCSN